MKQEDKDLLLKDLCARLPYEVKMNHIADTEVAPATLIGIAKDMITLKSSAGYSSADVEDYKPYLFPISSMTDEQYDEMYNYCYNAEREASKFSNGGLKIIYTFELFKFDWLNKNHFDYRGLIPKGLAINATELNIY